jgi:hypothetical protein
MEPRAGSGSQVSELCVVSYAIRISEDCPRVDSINYTDFLNPFALLNVALLLVSVYCGCLLLTKPVSGPDSILQCVVTPISG